MIAPNAMRPGLVGELVAEVGEGHPLHALTLLPVAKCGGCDEVVFRIEGGRFVRWARVHLTWSSRRESPTVPRTEIFDSFREAVETHAH